MHGVEIRDVTNEAAFRVTMDQTRLSEGFQVKRQGGRWNAEGCGNLSRHEARWPRLHQEPKHRKATFLGKCRERRNGKSGSRFHNCSNIELTMTLTEPIGPGKPRHTAQDNLATGAHPGLALRRRFAAIASPGANTGRPQPPASRPTF